MSSRARPSRMLTVGTVALALAGGAASTATAAGAERFDLAERLEGAPLPPGVRVPRVAPTVERGGYTAKILEETAVVASPGSRRRVWTAGTTSMHTGNATRLSVQQARFDADGRAWLEVLLPIRPNEARGWVPADAVAIEHTGWYLRMRLGDRSLSAYEGGRLRARVRGVIGAPATPTPTGLFAVYEIAKQNSPRDFLGPWAIHLTAFSNVLKNYGGGPGRVAIHGRGPQSILDAPLGAAASHGCVRISNDAVSWLRTRTAPGTPVRITVR
ncbi:L,D-transpeptidase [Patulibacter americanus]|uniref:L,D-transpeptidase n=1 Tax=Patulibacter americanus TaxID=588672 RepID=UPI0003B746A4|nr:L,D-transpeptidase [Patulibacter americanus]